MVCRAEQSSARPGAQPGELEAAQGLVELGSNQPRPLGGDGAPGLMWGPAHTARHFDPFLVLNEVLVRSARANISLVFLLPGR